MTRVTVLNLVFISLIACVGLGSQSAEACSCAPASLEKRYERSDNVFTAVITGGQVLDETAASSPRTRNSFKVTELFKGTIPFSYLNSHTGGASCGISLEIGVEYLIFAPDAGGIGLCSGIVPVSPDSLREADVGLKYVAALRAFESGKHESLAEPWQFSESRGICRLSAGFPYGEERWSGHVGVTYWTRMPDGVAFSPDTPHLKTGFTEMSIWVPEREDLVDHPLAISVNDREYSADWRDVQYSSARYFVNSNVVPALIADLVGADELKMTLAHPVKGELQFAASLLNAGDSVESMLGCIRGN